MIERVRTALLVAAFDFGESIRSRKAVGLLVLYVAGAIAATAGFLTVVHYWELALAKTLSVPSTEKAGAMTGQLFHSHEFLRFLSGILGDQPLAEALVAMPPLALFYGWLAMTFIPALVTLTSGDAISWEVATGSVRFALFRSDRLSWVLGKLTGQAGLMTVGLFGGAAVTWVMGLLFMNDFHPLSSGLWLLRFSGRAWFCGFAYLGLALGVSQATRSINGSRAASLFALFGVGFAGHFLGSHWVQKHLSWVLVSGVYQLFPAAHGIPLWQPAFLDRLPSMVMLTALGLLFFALGYWRFATRDR